MAVSYAHEDIAFLVPRFERLQFTMKRQWGVYSGDVDCRPDVDTIIKFLKKMMRTLPDEPKRVIRPVATPVRLREPRKSTVSRMKEMISLPTCGTCDKLYATHLCEVLKGQSVPGRYALVRRKRLCFNCLSKNHSIANCPSTRTCRECGAKHHLLLHQTPTLSAQIEVEREATPDDSTVVMSVMQQKKGIKTRTIFRTAIVNVSCGSYTRKVRAVLNTGSVLSLFSSRLVNSLRAKKVPAETGIEGIVGTSDCKHQVSLMVESAHQDDETFISFSANVWDRLQLDPTPAGVKDLRDRPFLKDIELADPDFHSGASIDLLLGCKECTECERQEIRDDEDGRAKAYNSMFGWIVGGSFPSNDKVDWRKGYLL